MILRSLRVEQFRRHNLPIDIAFDERLTIVSGLNETGKSTLFQALKYAFFRRSGAGGKDIDALLPWDTTGLSPTVRVEFTHDGIEYQLSKTWGKRAGSQISKRNAAGVFEPAMGTDADDFLARIFEGEPPKQGAFSGFTGHHLGLAYLLFVPQGAIPIEGDPKTITLNPEAGARLTNIVGAATQSPEAARISTRIVQAYGQHFTPGLKPKKNAPAAQTEQKLLEVEKVIGETRKRVEAFAAVADDLELAEEKATAAREVAEKSRRDAEQARPRYQRAVELKGLLGAAEREFESVDKAYAALLDRDGRLERADRKLAELKPRREALAGVVADAAAAHAAATIERGQATEAFAAVSSPDAALVALKDSLARGQRAASLRRDFIAVDARLQGASQLADRLTSSNAKIQELGTAEDDDCDAIRKLEETQRNVSAKLAAANTTFELVAERDLSIAVQDEGQERRAIPAGERFEISRAGDVSLHLEGVAQINVRGPLGDMAEAQGKLALCEAELAQFEQRFGTRDSQELQRSVDARRGRDAERTRLTVEREKVLDGWTNEALQQRLEQLSADLASLPHEPRVDELETAVAERETRRQAQIDSALQKMQAEDKLEAASAETLSRARATYDQFDATEWRPNEVELAGLSVEGESEEQRTSALREAHRSQFGAKCALEEAQNAYEPFRTTEDPAAELARIEEHKDNCVRAAHEADSAARTFEQKLTDDRDAAPEAVLTELEEAAARSREQLADERLTEAALSELRTFVVEAEERRIGDFAKPVLNLVAPWYESVTGSTLCGLDLSQHHAVDSLQLGGVSREVWFEELSYGAADQLALLVRLAFASLLTSPKCLGTMPVLLDDPLVNADWQRRSRFLNILAEVSSTAQIVVFTCRPEDYAGAAGRVVTIGSTPQVYLALTKTPEAA